MTLLDSRLLSEYACQRTAGAAARVVSRELAQGGMATIEQRSGIQGKDLIDKSTELKVFSQNIRTNDLK